MRRNNIRATIRNGLSVAATALLIAGLNLFVPAANAHGTMEHVTGSLVHATNDVLSVKTAKGATVDVHVDARTYWVCASTCTSTVAPLAVFTDRTSFVACTSVPVTCSIVPCAFAAGTKRFSPAIKSAVAATERPFLMVARMLFRLMTIVSF